MFIEALFIGFGVAAVSSGAGKGQDLSAMLPIEIDGWRYDGADGVYVGDNLYTYIDGAAEVYRSFNVRRVFARRYVKEGAPEIIADVFDMGSSKDAYGVYHNDVHEAAGAGIGQESEYAGGCLAFWKGAFYVSIITLEETPDSRRAVLDLGMSIARKIPSEGPLPDLVTRLPEANRMGDVRYFHDGAALQRYDFPDEKNVLNLGSETEGAAGRYVCGKIEEARKPRQTYVLLLIRYPSAVDAEKAHARFVEAYPADADSDGAAQTTCGKWWAVRRKGALLAGIFDAPTSECVADVLEKLLEGAAESNQEPKKG